MKKHLLLSLVAIAAISAAFWFAACQKDNAEANQSVSTLSATDRTPGDSKVFPPTAHPYGKSYTGWSIDWMHEFLPFDCAHNPWLNPAYVLFYQTGHVYFMAGLNTPGASANITIPTGKALLFPLINYINDYPCPDTSWHPAPGQSLQDFLTPGATDPMALVTNLSVTIDGSSVSDPAKYLFTTNLFYFTGNPDLSNCLDPCITGNSQAAVASGYYIMLKPLSKGQHTVHYHTEVPAWSAVQDGTFHINVVEPGHEGGEGGHHGEGDDE